jgi:hypothetical protein
MRPWSWVRRILALLVTVVFVLGITVAPAAAAKSRSFSSPKIGTSSKSRSFSTPKPSTPAPSRSYSTPKTTTPSTPPKSYSSPAPSTKAPTTPGYSSTPQGYSSSDRSYSTPGGSYTSPAPSRSIFGTPKTPTTPPPSYDVGKSNYPTRPPVIIYAPTPGFDPWYWHNDYWGRPWYWRMWHRPYYYSSGWGINYWPFVIAGGIGIWILLAVIASYSSRRRRH